jgi:hypothetical protein
MRTDWRLLVAMFLGVGAVIGITRIVSAQNNARESPNAVIQRHAHAAKSGDPNAIRDLTDAIFDQSLLHRAAPSLRDRVFRAELQFRKTGASSIDERGLVSAVNDQLASFQAPAFATTTVSQLRVLRGARRRSIPGMTEPTPAHEGAPSSAMSPAEAAYLALNLAMNKLMNPNFQVTPDEWETRLAHGDTTLSQRQSPQLRSHFIPEAMATLQSTVVVEIADESSTTVQIAHRFLDSVGFSR